VLEILACHDPLGVLWLDLFGASRPRLAMPQCLDIAQEPGCKNIEKQVKKEKKKNFDHSFYATTRYNVRVATHSILRATLEQASKPVAPKRQLDSTHFSNTCIR
jgi:hypothetical protein